jgi:glycosyltransferase involved in cell wall biosynthesis
MKILFFDSIAPYEYNYDILKKKGLGASESYLLSVAKELKKYCDIDITSQYNRYNYTQNDIVFKQLDEKSLGKNYDTIIIQRDPTNLMYLKKLYPKAKFIIWLHDFYESSIWGKIPAEKLQIIINNAKLICVSKWHKKNFETNLKLRKIKNINIDYNHFFIESPKFNSIKVDKYKLCFMSAGHKGLEFTLRIFEHLYNIDNKFKLYIANPTYDQEYDFKNSKGSVHNLGNITRDEVCKHLKGSLCALHLNKEYPETFGCVNAEANLMGTPVLAYDLGATSEILDSPYINGQIIEPNPYRVDLHNLTHITETILHWQTKRPEIKLNPILNKNKIIEKWKEIIL